jgi:hypothetical protein
MTDLTDLSKKMHALADTGHLRATELREKADEFDRNAAGFYAECQTCDVKTFMGSWARARRVWSECTGEPLIRAFKSLL